MDRALQSQEVDQNFDYFQRHLPEYLSDHPGQFVLLKDRAAINFFDNPGDAYRAGNARFADGIFSIQEVTDEAIDLGFFSHVAN